MKEYLEELNQLSKIFTIETISPVNKELLGKISYLKIKILTCVQENCQKFEDTGLRETNALWENELKKNNISLTTFRREVGEDIYWNHFEIHYANVVVNFHLDKLGDVDFNSAEISFRWYEDFWLIIKDSEVQLHGLAGGENYRGEEPLRFQF